MANRLVSLVALAVATGVIAALRGSSRTRAARETPKAPPAPVQTWEGEGGALPATGPQMGPDPANTPAAEVWRRDDAISGIH